MSTKNYNKYLIIFIVLCAITVLRVLSLQISHFQRAENYLKEKDYKLAIREYDTAMHFYLPLSPYIEHSAQRLWEIGEIYEKNNKPDWALIAYSSIRSSFYAARSLYTPGKEWIDRCDDKISSLNVKILLEEGSISAKDADSERERHLYVLRTDRAPEPIWAVLAEVGFLGWVGSVLFSIYYFQEKRRLLYGSASFALFFYLWAIALLKA